MKPPDQYSVNAEIDIIDDNIAVAPPGPVLGARFSVQSACEELTPAEAVELLKRFSTDISRKYELLRHF